MGSQSPICYEAIEGENHFWAAGRKLLPYIIEFSVWCYATCAKNILRT